MPGAYKATTLISRQERIAPAERGGIVAAGVRRFEAELKKKNPSVEFVLYPGAAHAFFSDDRPRAYRKDAAEDGWERCVAFFSKHLKA
jgi:carboxymethylenebutenolidase